MRSIAWTLAFAASGAVAHADSHPEHAPDSEESRSRDSGDGEEPPAVYAPDAEEAPTSGDPEKSLHARNSVGSPFRRHGKVTVYSLFREDTDRLGISVGASTGWRETLDVQVRGYVTHRWSAGARYRRAFVGDADVGELYAGYAIGTGYGKLLFDPMFMRVMVEGTAGVARTETDRGVTGSLGAALRMQPAEWIELELGARESWLPQRTLEVGFAVTLLIGEKRRVCRSN